MLAWAATGDEAKVSTAYEVGGWQEIPAIQNRRVYVIRDELLNTPGPPLVQGAKELWRLLHAESREKDNTEVRRPGWGKRRTQRFAAE